MVVDHPLSPGGATHALLDANVLLPPRLSDVLFDLCLEGLFWARWSADIEAEFLRNWPRVVAGATIDMSSQQAAGETVKAQRRLDSYKRAVRGHEIIGHGAPSVLARVPAAVDVGDKHVAAAALVLRDLALQDNPDDKVFIVSSNVKHLAVADMKRLGILVVAPGKFIDSLTRADAARVGSALDRCVKSLKNPLYTRARLLESLQLHGARATARQFASAWGVRLPPRDGT
ncbi:hypothetical protein JOD97_001178 [Duganella sp. 1411]|uniref:hypothetical protein n=1 Tax=Duganella sp. 1411 TaxID=2806572 RepID=UPI001AE5B934|nr:hypothetical protein [Duganella sp. 1411]MBP1203164.1 hypothetical protein [Duganella sp. 1411]